MLAAFGLPPWLGHLADLVPRLIAAAILAACFLWMGASRRALGQSFTAFPRPVETGVLVTSGPYRFARHPIYTAVIVGSAAWAVFWTSAAGGACTVLLFAFFDLKARREERWLAEAYAGYEAYRGRVKRLVPFVY